MNDNPYRSPQTGALPINAKGRQGWFGRDGDLVIAMAYFIWSPILLNLLSIPIFGTHKDQIWIFLGSLSINGTCGALLHWFGRYLRRKQMLREERISD